MKQHLIYMGLLHFIARANASGMAASAVTVDWQSLAAENFDFVVSLTKYVFVGLLTQSDNRSA